MELKSHHRIAYLESGGKECPYCGSEELVPDDEEEMSVDGILARRGCTCNGCGEQWNDIYIFAGIE